MSLSKGIFKLDFLIISDLAEPTSVESLRLDPPPFAKSELLPRGGGGQTMVLATEVIDAMSSAPPPPPPAASAPQAKNFKSRPLMKPFFTLKIALLEVQNSKFSRLRRALYSGMAWV